MSKSLVSFLERRKKNAVKASALLQQTEEPSLDEKSDYRSDDIVEENSEHDDEWKVSDDDQNSNYQTSSIGAGLMKIVQTVACDENAEEDTTNDQIVSHQVWHKKVQQENAQEPAGREGDGVTTTTATTKIWVPKFKLNSQNLSSKNDLDLAESAKLIAKTENLFIGKKKKTKKKSNSQDGDLAEDDEESFVKIKFDVFQILDDKFQTFRGSEILVNEDLVKKKYISRPKTIFT